MVLVVLLIFIYFQLKNLQTNETKKESEKPRKIFEESERVDNDG